MRYAVLLCLALSACHVGGKYETGTPPMIANLDRGETNGRMFDFVTNRSDGDDWDIRLRGSSMYVSYADRSKVRQLGTKNLTTKEADKLWAMIDKIDIPHHRKGRKDKELGWVELRLHVPTENNDPDHPNPDEYKNYVIYVPRDNDDLSDHMLDLLDYMQDLVKRHFRTMPNF